MRDRFLRELARVASEFDWELDHRRGWRASLGQMEFCPATALYYRSYGKRARTVQVHAALEDMGYGYIATEIVDAIDEGEGPLSKAVGRICAEVSCR